MEPHAVQCESAKIDCASTITTGQMLIGSESDGRPLGMVGDGNLVQTSID